MRRHRTHVIRKGLRSGEISRRRPSQAPNVSSNEMWNHRAMFAHPPLNRVTLCFLNGSPEDCAANPDPRYELLHEPTRWKNVRLIEVVLAFPGEQSWNVYDDTSKFWPMILLCCFPKLQEWSKHRCLLSIQCRFGQNNFDPQKNLPNFWVFGRSPFAELSTAVQLPNYHSLPKTPVIM